MNSIKNYAIYTDRMNKTMTDKLFFLSELEEDVNTIVDFGCADASLSIGLQNTKYEYIGYDIDKTMLDKAEENVDPMVLFYDFDEMLSKIEPKNCVLVLSSVIHEVYSYGNEYEIEKFWDRVFNSGFTQIAIRDMGLQNNRIAYSKVDPLNALTITQEIYNRHKDYIPIIYYKDYYQLLLKYWYSENWLRESKEDYFPITVSEIYDKVRLTDYHISYEDGFTIPFVVEKVKTELGLEMKRETHYKLILTL